MQRRQWDVVLQVQDNGTLVNVMLSLFGVRALADYYLPKQWVAHTNLMMPYPANQHEVVRHIGLMEFPQGYELELKPAEADQQLARQLLTRAKADLLTAGPISGLTRQAPATIF